MRAATTGGRPAALASVTVLGAIVRSFDQLRQRLSFVEPNGSVAQL